MTSSHQQALAEACSTLEQALQTCSTLEEKSASLEAKNSTLEQEKAALTQQVSALRAKLAQQEQVVLEKVASTKRSPAFDEAVLRETIGQLVDLSLVSAAETEKLASHLRQDPNSALRLVQRVVTLSLPSHSEGRALEKSANHAASESDPDGWGRVIKQGAA